MATVRCRLERRPAAPPAGRPITRAALWPLGVVRYLYIGTTHVSFESLQPPTAIARLLDQGGADLARAAQQAQQRRAARPLAARDLAADALQPRRAGSAWRRVGEKG